MPPSVGAAGEGTDPGPPGPSRAVYWVVVLLVFVGYGVRAKPLEWIRTDLDRSFSKAVDSQTLLWMVSVHPLIVAPVVAVLLIVAGLVGNDLGLPDLFRNPPLRDRRAERGRLERAKTSGGRVASYAPSRGGGTAFWGAFGVTLLTALAWTMIYYAEVSEHLYLFADEHFRRVDFPGDFRAFAADGGFWSHGELLRFLGWTGGPFLALFLAAEVAIKDRAAREPLSFLAGLAFGVVVVVGLAKAGASLHGAAYSFWEWGWPSRLLLGFEPPSLGGLLSWGKVSLFRIGESGVNPGRDAAKRAVVASLGQVPLVVLGFYAVLALGFSRRLSTGLTLCVLLTLVTLFFSILMHLSTAGLLIAAGLLLGYFVFANGWRFKNRFPGMGDSYDQRPPISLIDLAERSDATGDVGLLDDQATLKAWSEATGRARPKLVVVATTGGAYRASFWTTVVLDELSRFLPGFQRHVRLLSGASGGMVGAAYFVASMSRTGEPVDTTALLQEESGLDSLAPVIRHLVLRDLPHAFWPARQAVDRGVALERHWKTLAKTFPELKDGEKEGWRPSLVLSPMIVESGRRLLISNLDLRELAETKAAVPTAAEGIAGAAGAKARLFSRSAIEFFRVFPKARKEFSLQTAVRMSATFPFASPAVQLPMDVTRRVVDAGYYDNYGVDLATSWIYANRGKIRELTSGVALVQIRAHPSEEETQSHLGLPGAGGKTWLDRAIDRVVTSFHGLSSPLSGGLSAREASMKFRNATQVRVLDDLLNPDGKPRMFETFLFENSTEFAMNWFLRERDIDRMRDGIDFGEDLDSAADETPPAEAPASEPDRAAACLARDYRDENRRNKRALRDWWHAPARDGTAADRPQRVVDPDTRA